MKSVGIRSYSGPYFPAFGLNMERYSVSLRIQSACGKIRTRITPNTDPFYPVCICGNNQKTWKRNNVKFTQNIPLLNFFFLDWNLPVSCLLSRLLIIEKSILSLTLSWRGSWSYRSHSINLHCKSMDWFLYDRDLRYERVNH